MMPMTKPSCKFSFALIIFLVDPVPQKAASQPAPSTPASAPSKPSKPEVELDLEGMMDVTNYAGVDLKEEEFSLNDMGGAYYGSQEKYKQIPFLNVNLLEEKILDMCKIFWNLKTLYRFILWG
jgi:hypothetical protein